MRLWREHGSRDPVSAAEFAQRRGVPAGISGRVRHALDRKKHRTLDFSDGSLFAIGFNDGEPQNGRCRIAL